MSPIVIIVAVLAAIAFYIALRATPIVEPVPSREPDLAPLTWKPRTQRWCQTVVFRGGALEVCLDGNETGPSAEAMGAWLDLRPRLSDQWDSVVEFAIRQTARDGVQSYESDEFGATSVDVCPEDPFDGGDIVFYFTIASEPGGEFSVALRDGTPLRVHRDGERPN